MNNVEHKHLACIQYSSKPGIPWLQIRSQIILGDVRSQFDVAYVVIRSLHDLLGSLKQVTAAKAPSMRCKDFVAIARADSERELNTKAFRSNGRSVFEAHKSCNAAPNVPGNAPAACRASSSSSVVTMVARNTCCNSGS